MPVIKNKEQMLPSRAAVSGILAQVTIDTARVVYFDGKPIELGPRVSITSDELHGWRSAHRDHAATVLGTTRLVRMGAHSYRTETHDTRRMTTTWKRAEDN